MTRLALFAALTVACSTTAQTEPEPDAHVMEQADAGHTMIDAPAAPLKPYGAACAIDSQCQGGRCITGACTRPCSLAVANDCKPEKAFCAPTTSEGDVCYGHVDTGSDADDAVMQIGDSVTRTLSPLGDSDLFLVHLDTLGNTKFMVTPTAGIDVELDVYDPIGQAVLTQNAGGPSIVEAAQTNVQQIGGWMFAVVRDVGTSTGDFTFTVTHI